MSFDAHDVDRAIEDNLGWSEVAYLEKDEPFALILDGRAVVVRTVGKSKLGVGATDVWTVVEAESRHFRKTGYHQSHDGTYWDGSVEEVRPAQKTITVYENI
jgi:hypothetical protein